MATRLTRDAYAWPGGYSIIYYTRDGLTICHLCASDVDTSDPVVGSDVYWEGPTLYCEDGHACRDASGSPRAIESAYGDPDAEDGAR